MWAAGVKSGADLSVLVPFMIVLIKGLRSFPTRETFVTGLGRKIAAFVE